MEGRFTQLFPARRGGRLRRRRTQVPCRRDDLAVPRPSRLPRPRSTPEENSGIEAAYTYLGQFIDHDLTFDPTSQLRQPQPMTTDQLDGAGRLPDPALRPRQRLRAGPERPALPVRRPTVCASPLGERSSGNPIDPHAVDLPRGAERAGADRRSAERREPDRLAAPSDHAPLPQPGCRRRPSAADFAGRPAQVAGTTSGSWSTTSCRPSSTRTTIRSVFPHLATDAAASLTPVRRLASPRCSRASTCMPVEFSVAAYRFGHSMIRPIYRLNETISRRPIFSSSRDAAANLGGFLPIPVGLGARLAVLRRSRDAGADSNA